jgi:periplasmic protein CpxP/Spy
MNTHRNIPLAAGFIIVLGTMLAIPSAWADSGFRCGKGQTLSQHGGRSISVTDHLIARLFFHQKEIGLNDDQIAKLRTVALDADRAAIRASADRQLSERELRAMISDAKSEMTAIEAKVKEAESLEATMRIIGIRAKRELMALLTPEQQAKVTSLRHGYRHHDRMPAQSAPSRQSDLDDSPPATSAGYIRFHAFD